MTETIFWEMIEQAWTEASPTLKNKRMKIASKKGAKEPTDLSIDMADLVGSDLVDVLTEKLRKMSKEDLLAFDRILERKMYDIDRADIHEYTDGTHDGFLYARGFIVGMGKAYYELISQEPDRATFDLDAEGFCYFPVFLYDELYGKFPISDISRETGRNLNGWEE
jgi:Protein of unknown function (DUF4240)